MEKVKFQVPDTEETADFFVVEQTRINGVDYLLVTEEEDGDCDAYILKDISGQQETEAIYEMVETEEELEALFKVFASLLEDVDIYS